MTQTILNSLPIGNPGDISRSGVPTIDSVLQHATYPVDRYGVPVIDDAGAAKGVTAGTVPGDIKGFLVRSFPSLGGLTSNEDWGAATPPLAPAVLSQLRRGFTFVKVLYGSAVKGAKVYVRAAVTSSTRLQGGIEAGAVATVTSPAIVGTGSGTIACTVADAAKIKAGTHVITLLETSQTAAVQVVDPDGIRLADGVVGTAYSQQGLAFTITAGGTMTKGDKYSPVVTPTTIEVPGAKFTGVVDADGIAEIEYNI